MNKYPKKHEKYIQNILDQLPEGVKRSNIGYRCSYCHTGNMNSKVAIRHDCEKVRETHKNRVRGLESPTGGFYMQCGKRFV